MKGPVILLRRPDITVMSDIDYWGSFPVRLHVHLHYLLSAANINAAFVRDTVEMT